MEEGFVQCSYSYCKTVFAIEWKKRHGKMQPVKMCPHHREKMTLS